MLEYLGARIETNKNLISLKSPNCLSPNKITVPGDFSSAAFIIVAVLITKNSNVKILNVGLNFYRTGLLDILSKMGGTISISNKKTINNELVGDIEVGTSNLKCVNTTGEISPRMIDEFPILFVAASFAKGKSKFNGIGELKIKESNRLKVMHDVLKILGVDIKMGDDFIEIVGKEKYNNVKKIQTFRDHRIAMSVLVFGMASIGEITIDDMSMIKTSFPGFKEIFEKIGAQIKFI
jgi:3-phosphoshikimate 1-carboxyvinyltransferase